MVTQRSMQNDIGLNADSPAVLDAQIKHSQSMTKLTVRSNEAEYVISVPVNTMAQGSLIAKTFARITRDKQGNKKLSSTAYTVGELREILTNNAIFPILARIDNPLAKNPSVIVAIQTSEDSNGENYITLKGYVNLAASKRHDEPRKARGSQTEIVGAKGLSLI